MWYYTVVLKISACEYTVLEKNLHKTGNTFSCQCVSKDSNSLRRWQLMNSVTALAANKAVTLESIEYM